MENIKGARNMTFYIYREANVFILSDGEASMACATEGEAIDAAVRIAQGSLYCINYFRP